jgi:hypothetical protein
MGQLFGIFGTAVWNCNLLFGIIGHLFVVMGQLFEII